jgi:hypothetical protein
MVGGVYRLGQLSMRQNLIFASHHVFCMGVALDNVEKKLKIEHLSITTVPFVAHYSNPLELLDSICLEFKINTIDPRE